MDQGWHRFQMRIVPHGGNCRDADIARKAWEMNEPVFAHVESAHPGDLPGLYSFAGTDTPGIALTILKKSEDGDRVIVRGYEINGVETSAEIRIPGATHPIKVSFTPYEIKTIRVNPTDGSVTETNLLEEADA